LREKQQLLNGMPQGSWVILNGDDPYLRKMALKRRDYHVIRYGIEHKADYRASGISVENNGHIRFRVAGRVCVLKTPARHHVDNALAAISCGRLLRIQYNALIASLRAYTFHGCRQEVKRIGKAILIDDTYNANPVSFKAAIRTLDDLKTPGKKVLIAADMLELGSQARRIHEAVGKMIARSSVDVVLTTGTCAAYMAKAVRQGSSRIEVDHCQDLSRLHARLKALGGERNIFLVKGSRGMRMERTVEFLKKHLQKEG
jgi:UDP-N-acetylmuramoyl-tripeptide--D-alanyl-D-alanine ligase